MVIRDHLPQATMTTKLGRVEGKHIKHAPSRRFKHADLDSLIHIHHKTPHISAVKRVDKMLKELPKRQPKMAFVTVRGMAAAIDRCLCVGVHFQAQGYTVEVETKTVDVLDEFEQEDDENMLRKRQVSSVELKVYKRTDL